MQTNELSPFMEHAVTEVLEAMCFISSEGAAANDLEQLPSDWIGGELNFQGDISGRFGIAVPPASAAIIAANFLGEDESDLTERDTSEVICELTNMVCGTLLAQVNSNKIFTLSPPRRVHKIVSGPHSERIHRTYTIDEGCIHAWVELEAFA